MGCEIGAFPIPEHWCGAAHSGRELDLHTSARREIDRIAGMQTAQFLGNLIQIGDDSICRKVLVEMSANVFGQWSMATTKKKRSEQTFAAEAVNSDDGVDMIHERLQAYGGIGGDFDRRNVSLHSSRLMNPVITRITQCGRLLSDDVGHLFQSATVVGHEAQTMMTLGVMTAQSDDLFDIGMIQ